MGVAKYTEFHIYCDFCGHDGWTTGLYKEGTFRTQRVEGFFINRAECRTEAKKQGWSYKMHVDLCPKCTATQIAETKKLEVKHGM